MQIKTKLLHTVVLLFFSTSLFMSCTDDSTVTDNNKPTESEQGIIQISKDGFTESNSAPLLADNEPDEVLFNQKMRSLRINQPLQIEINEQQELYFKYYGPRKTTDLTVWGQIIGYDEEFKLAHFDEIPPFTEFHQKLPATEASKVYQTRSGKKIRIEKNPYLSAADLKISVECNDKFYKQVTEMPYNVRVEFSAYSGSGSWAYKILPAHCRESIAFIMNMGWMFSQERTKDTLNAYSFYANNDPSSLIPKQTILDRTMRKNGTLVLGHTSGVNGLGGGNTYGVAEWQFVSHYADDSADSHTFFHEYGHCMGYGHDGNMTYGDSKGFTEVCRRLYTEMSRNKELPVYSRRFLGTRKNGKLYGSEKYLSSRYVIEDPELDAIDGGLVGRKLGELSDPTKGTPLSLTIDYTKIPGATEATFTPKDVCASGNRVYVLNDASVNGTTHFSVEVFSEADGKLTHLKSLKEWSFRGATQTFIGTPKGIACDGERLFVNNINSRTDVFDARSLEFITAIGTGNWGDGGTQTVHAYETVAAGGFVFIKDKKKVNIYDANDLTPDAYTRVSRFAQTERLSEADVVYGADIDSKGRLYTTYAPGKKIYTYNVSSILESSILPPAGTALSLTKTPVDVVCFNSRVLVAQNSAPRLIEIDPANGTTVKDYSSVYAFKNLEKMSVARATLFAVDRGNKIVIAIPLTQFN